MIGRLLATVVGLFCALALSQAPEFAQQYRQRLGGAIDELRRIVETFDITARDNGLTRGDAISRLNALPDPIARGQGAAMTGIIDRMDRLDRQRAAFAEAGPFARVVALAQNPDPQLARATYVDFEPAWPATVEGLVTGAIGFVLGWLLVFLPRRWGHRLTHWRRTRAAPGGLRSA